MSTALVQAGHDVKICFRANLISKRQLRPCWPICFNMLLLSLLVFCSGRLFIQWPLCNLAVGLLPGDVTPWRWQQACRTGWKLPGGQTCRAEPLWAGLIQRACSGICQMYYHGVQHVVMPKAYCSHGSNWPSQPRQVPATSTWSGDKTADRGGH